MNEETAEMYDHTVGRQRYMLARHPSNRRPSYTEQLGSLIARFGPPGQPRRGFVWMETTRPGDVITFRGNGPYTVTRDPQSAGFWTRINGEALFVPSENVQFCTTGVSGCSSGREFVGVLEWSEYTGPRYSIR